MPPPAATLDQARAAKAAAHALFSKIAPVVGVGITRIGAGYGVKVNLQDEPPRGRNLPDAVDGVPVRVEVIGPIRKR
jgi:hypothetical protein